MKEEEKDIRQLFDAFQPQMSSGADFMSQLDRRLDAIEYIRKIQTKEKKRNRTTLLCTFAGGLVVGCALYAFLMSQNDVIPSITIDTHFLLLRIIGENIQLFTYVLLCSIAIVGIVMAVGMWNEMLGFKDAHDLSRQFCRRARKETTQV